MNGLYLRLIGGIALGALILSLGIAIKVNGGQAQEILTLKASLVTASGKLAQASADITRFSVKESVVATEAAKLCAAEGNTAFTRGVEVGTAICEARQ